VSNFSLAFLWHLHQPLYRLRGERVCSLPWVRLHAIRSYFDMIRILEEFPEVQVTFNLVPSLIEQIRSYEQGNSDLFWETGARPAEELDEADRRFLLDHFFSAQPEKMIGAFPRYVYLLDRRNRARRIRGTGDAWKEFATADYRDLQALFDLSWFGFKAREEFPELRALFKQGLAYTQQNIREIHEIERVILRQILPLYRAAAERGQIEISTSPYAHPILPLVIDSESAREALPSVELPLRFRAPQDARAQVVEALTFVEREMGVRPRGMWPSEGSLSQETSQLLAECGVAWTASDDQVLNGSEREGAADPCLPWETTARGIFLVFRDHALSDRVGFSYAKIGAAAAVAEFLSIVRRRFESREGRAALLLVALDGENPWEHYHRSGADFLQTLYEELAREPSFTCRSVAGAVAACPERGKIRRLRAGSWIEADFSTWIGGPEKNRAWNILGRVHSDLSGALGDPGLPESRRREAWESIRAAEGSDWFWWLDGQFSSLYRAQFDQAFRGHLRQAYEALGVPVPDFLSWPVPSQSPGEGPLTETFAWLSPEIDGFQGDFFEWDGAVEVAWADLTPGSSMQRARRLLDSLRFGFSRTGEFLLRIDPGSQSEKGGFAHFGLDLAFRAEKTNRHLSVDLDGSGDLRETSLRGAAREEGEAGMPAHASSARAAARKIFELAIPAEEVGLHPGVRASLQVHLRIAGERISLNEIDLRVPSFSSRGRVWSVL